MRIELSPDNKAAVCFFQVLQPVVVNQLCEKNINLVDKILFMSRDFKLSRSENKGEIQPFIGRIGILIYSYC